MTTYLFFVLDMTRLKKNTDGYCKNKNFENES